MKTVRSILFRALLPALLPLASCSDRGAGLPDPAARTIEVTVGSQSKPQIEAATRTALGDDGTSVHWTDEDRIALWAVGAQNGAAVEGAPLRLFHYNATYRAARFTGEVPAMAEDAYTYYAVAPLPVAASGLRASFDLPAVQDGAFHGTYDVLVADPLPAKAALHAGDNSDEIDFRFRHKVHILKIRIPESHLTDLLGAPSKIAELVLTFPAPVAGRMTVDAADPEAEPVIEGEGSRTLTLRFDEPKEPGETVYAFIRPLRLEPDQEVTITAVGPTCESEARTFAPQNAERAFAAGHITPITYTVPAAAFHHTLLNFRLLDTGEATLGERIETFTLTAPEGLAFDNGSNVRTFQVNRIGDYTLRFRDCPDYLAGQQIEVAYESPNALLTRTVTLPPLQAQQVNQAAELSVPYLFAEDFDATSAHDWGSEWKSTDPNNTAPSELDACGLTGWTGSRVGVDGGALRISCNTIIVFGNPQSRRAGRVDTAPLSGIKPGKTPTVRVQYTYCGTLYEGTGSGGNILATAGYTRQPGGIDSSDTISDVTVPETALDKDATNNNTHYDLAGLHANDYTIPEADNTVRLSWYVTTDRKGGIGGNGCYWLYIDNIQVSIVPTP